VNAGDRLLDSVVVAAERLAWGFTNESWRVDLADGRRVAVQEFRDPATAARRVALMRALPPRFQAAGLPALPDLIEARDRCAVTEWIDGTVGSELLEGGMPVGLAAEAAALARRLRLVDASGLDLPAAWASAEALAAACTDRLAALSGVSQAALQRLASATERLPGCFARRAAVFAHGDLNPSNLLVDAAGCITAIVDLEFARLAHPAFDACWWDWVVRFHYPSKWRPLREAFEAAGGLDDLEADDLLVLQQLRTLEFVSEAPAATRPMWVERLEVTARWT
jgi:aminoglycoside phosphotransferase (APT) family kinase protein